MNKQQTGIFQEKKIHKLFMRMSVFSLIFVFLLIVFLVNLKIILTSKIASKNKLEDLNIQNNSIIREIENIEKKSKVAEGYIKTWEENFSEKQKKLQGINIDDLQKTIESIAKDTKIENLEINFSPVILAGKNLEKKNIKTFTTLVNIEFTSITDINVFMFLDKLKEDLGYFITIQEFNLKKVKKIITEELLKNLSEGENMVLVSGNIKIRIYGLGKM